MKKQFSHANMLERLIIFKKNILSSHDEKDFPSTLSSASMHNYKVRKNIPKGDSLEEWGRCFGLNLNWLLWGEGEMLRHQKDVTDAAASLADTEERKGELERRYAENLEELNALKTEFIDLQKELLCIHRGRRQDRRTYGSAPTLAPTGDTAT